MDSVFSNEVARRIAADLATLVSEAEKHWMLYFTEGKHVDPKKRAVHSVPLGPTEAGPGDSDSNNGSR